MTAAIQVYNLLICAKMKSARVVVVIFETLVQSTYIVGLFFLLELLDTC